jgi:hypothetical protein
VTIETAAWLALLVAVVATYLVARTTYRIGRKVVRRASSRLIDRAVDAVLFVLLFRWLDGRKRQQARPRPAVLTGDDIYLGCPLSRWQGDPMACRWCNGLLPARATRWCAARCRITATTNHDYRLAHDAALERDRFTCTRAGCGATASFDRAIETNHIELARGRHDQPGCIHHLSNLESLCGRHHDEVTAGQRARGWAS